jgi:hypothetical protein
MPQNAEEVSLVIREEIVNAKFRTSKLDQIKNEIKQLNDERIQYINYF